LKIKKDEIGKTKQENYGRETARKLQRLRSFTLDLQGL
jgi:hypothetical protein